MSSAVSMKTVPMNIGGQEKSDNVPTAFSTIYNKFVPDPRKQNVTTQVYMKSYIQESLRYLRDKARDYEKNNSSQSSGIGTIQSPEKNKNETNSVSSKTEQKMVKNEVALDKTMPEKIEEPSKKVSNDNSQKQTTNEINARSHRSGINDEKVKVKSRSHEKQYRTKHYNVLNQQ